MKTNKTLFFFMIAICVMLFVCGCGAEEKPEEIKIAVAGPMDRMKGEFQNGIDMAVKELNKDRMKDTPVKVDYYDDKLDMTTGMQVAQHIVDQEEPYSAVIGHWNATINIAVASIYEKAKMTAISPMVSAVELTQSDNSYIFRTVPTDADEVKRVVKYAKKKGYEKIAICYADTDYGKGLAKEFEKACNDRKISVLDSHGSFVNKVEFSEQYSKWQALNIDAVFIADALPDAAHVVKQIRSKDKSMPILSAGGFSFNSVVKLTGPENSQHIAFTTLYDPKDDFPGKVAFNRAYKDMYKTEPKSFLASKGYETVYLIVDAMKGAQSAVSENIAKYLRHMGKWEGVLDDYSFKKNGDPKGIGLYIVEVNDGAYKYTL